MKSRLLNRLADHLVATPDWRNKAVDFFTEQFTAREPLARALRMTTAGFRPLAEVIVDDALSAKKCILTHDSRTGRVTGLFLSRDATVEPSRDLSTVCPEAAPIHQLLSALSRSFHEQHPARAGKTLDCMFALVDGARENQNVGKILGLKGIPAYFAQGYEEAHSCLTNPRSQKLWVRCGGTLHGRIDPAEFFRERGLSLAEPVGPVIMGYYQLDPKSAAKGAAGLVLRMIKGRPAARGGRPAGAVMEPARLWRERA